MKTLLFIGCDPHVAAVVRDLADLCGVRLVQAKTCPSAWQLIEGPVAFDAVAIELWPWLSRLVLLADLHERFDDLPILAVMNSGDLCQKILVEAYGARVAMQKAHLHAGGLAQAFGWSTNLAPMAGRASSADAENMTGGRKSFGASPTPASRLQSMSRVVAAKPLRNRVGARAADSPMTPRAARIHEPNVGKSRPRSMTSPDYSQPTNHP